MVDMPAAWRVTYGIRLVGVEEDVLTKVKWRGEMSNDRFQLRESEDETTVGELTVVSSQPYRDDAFVECGRFAQDFCSMFAVDRHRPFSADDPPLRVEQLDGAKSDSHGGGTRITVSGSASLEMRLGAGKDLPALASAVGRSAELRADCDTFALAVGEADEPTRLVTLFRLYDSLAARAMEQEPRLLSDDEIATMTEAALGSIDLPNMEDAATADRILNAIRNALARLRSSSRPELLRKHLQERGHDVDIAALRQIDKERGKHAHTAAVAETKVDPEVLSVVLQVVATELERALES